MELLTAIEKKYNFLLVGCDTVKERDGISELWHVLVKYCNITPIDTFELPIRGLFLIAIQSDLIETINKLSHVIINSSFNFKVCKKFTPIERIIKSDLKLLEDNISELLQKVPKQAKWRISVQRRHIAIKRTDVINIIASHPLAPKGKVDLANPEWEIIVEIFGEWIGLGVFKAFQVLSIIDGNNIQNNQ